MRTTSPSAAAPDSNHALSPPAATGIPPKRPLSIDGVARRQAQAKQQATAATRTPSPTTTTAVPGKKDFRPPQQPVTPQRKFLGRLQLPLVIIAGIAAGVVVQSAAIGQVVVLIYGALAIMLRIESRTTMILALLALITTVVAATTQPGSLMDKNFAIYAFLLLIIGIISATIEHHQQRRLLTKKRGPQRFAQRVK